MMVTRRAAAACVRGAVRGFVAAAFIAHTAVPAAADPVLEWNDTARLLVVVPALAPVEQTRAMAMVHVAMHDAVSAVTRDYESYRATPAAPAGASPEAAAVGAAYGALRAMFGSSTLLSNRYASSLATNQIDPADPGLAFGEAVGQAIWQSRSGDGALQARFPYLPAGAGDIGVWMPLDATAASQALLPGWGNVQPWVLRSTSQFRPEPPPEVDSERYARDYEEVVRLGAASSSERVTEQTQIALFWRASPTALWNPILRRAVASRQLTLAEGARVTALFYLAAADASVACWEAKYFYNFWRPQFAIAQGELDGNPATTGDPAWLPLVRPTPAHPEYPSGHTANSGAMAAILALMFGDDPGFVIEATSPQNVGFVRNWQTFSEGVREVIDARVFSGIHFRASDEVGARLGRQVARFVLTHALRPVKGH